jgi:hypothetical protein
MSKLHWVRSIFLFLEPMFCLLFYSKEKQPSFPNYVVQVVCFMISLFNCHYLSATQGCLSKPFIFNNSLQISITCFHLFGLTLANSTTMTNPYFGSTMANVGLLHLTFPCQPTYYMYSYSSPQYYHKA